MVKVSQYPILCCTFALSTLLAIGCGDLAIGKSNPNNSLARIADAERIIKASNVCKEHFLQVIAQADAATAEAHRLTGRANRYENLAPIQIKPLKGAQLDQAKEMYRSDLSEFAKHAIQYQDHTDNVRKVLGSCHSSEDEYERNKASYTLHCDSYHLPNIPPPHICHAMTMSASELNKARNQAYDSMKRLAESQQELSKQEKALSRAMSESNKVDSDLAKQYQRNLKEQELLVEFSKLKEEHRQLEIERKTLQASGVKIDVKTVSAKITKKAKG